MVMRETRRGGGAGEEEGGGEEKKEGESKRHQEHGTAQLAWQEESKSGRTDRDRVKA